MSAAEGYAGVVRILTADQPETTEDQAVDLLAELSRKMAEAAAEFRRPATFDLKGTDVAGEWPEAK